MKKILYFLIAIALWFHFYHIGKAPPYGPGIIAAGEPYQWETSEPAMDIDSFEIRPRASFEGEARVLAAEHFYLDRKAWLSPMDIVIGWGNLSDEEILSLVKFDQSSRSYSWVNSNPNIDDEEITLSTANLNIIPADNIIADKLDRIKIGQFIRFSGLLVDVERTMHWKWKTSLSRRDRGSKASEILYLTELEFYEP